MTTHVLTHLMFDGDAEAAMKLYVSLIPDSRIVAIEHYEEGDSKGRVHQARFQLGGRDFICIDTPIKHAFTFTPSMSIFVEFDNREALEECFGKLSEQGQVMMPLDDYGFSPLFGWTSDRFGVSWQLNLQE